MRNHKHEPYFQRGIILKGEVVITQNIAQINVVVWYEEENTERHRSTEGDTFQVDSGKAFQCKLSKCTFEGWVKEPTEEEKRKTMASEQNGSGALDEQNSSLYKTK